MDKQGSTRIINVDGSGLRILKAHGSREQEVTPRAWSPDGSEILVTLHGGATRIALMSAQDGSIRVLKTLGWHGPQGVAFSPDGRQIAYDMPRDNSTSQRDIVVLATDASREHIVVEHPADERLLGWSGDGRSVVFSSDRSQSPGIWSIERSSRFTIGAAHPILASTIRSARSSSPPVSGWIWLRSCTRSAARAATGSDRSCHPN